MGGVVDVVGVGDEVGLAMCPGDGCPQLAKTRRHLTVGRASAILSVGPARELCLLVGLSAGAAGSAGPVGSAREFCLLVGLPVCLRAL